MAIINWLLKLEGDIKIVAEPWEYFQHAEPFFLIIGMWTQIGAQTDFPNFCKLKTRISS